MPDLCRYTIWGPQGKIVAPKCVAHEVLALAELGVRVVDASCRERTVWVEHAYAEDMIALGYEQIAPDTFRLMSNVKEECYYDED